MRRRRVFWWIAVPILGMTVVTMVLVAYFLRPAYIKRIVVSGLTEHLNLEADIEHISVTLIPRPRVSGMGLTLRIPDRPDLPPFISLDHFSVDVGLLSIARKHVETVHADGLRIAVPPGGDRDALGGNGDGGIPEVIVDHFVTHDAELMFVPRDAAKTPLVFAIHDLDVYNVGFGTSMPFTASLTNPVPQGEVKASGEIGPWRKESGIRTPLSGKYTFTDANLATINGIGGTLQSSGQFTGDLVSIAATGDATIPNFSLDLGGRPVPLTASFDTIVNGTDGTTVLKRVDAKMAGTPMHVTGAITNLEGPGRRDVKLDVRIPDGRIEDVLALVIDAPEPVMTGDVTLEVSLALPPGPTRVRDRLTLDGKFGLAATEFTNDVVQTKLAELSRRSQGQDQDQPVSRVMTDLKGRFSLRAGHVSLRGLTFEVPGARIALNGTYALSNEALDFRGTLQMKATVSQAVGGFKSIFIKPFDPLFRRDGMGAVVPIKIEGTRQAPRFGVEMGKIF